MNIKPLLFLSIAIIFLSEVASANPPRICKVGVITANVIDKNTQLPGKVETDQLRAFLVRNSIDADDIFGIEQDDGKIYLFSNNFRTIVNGNPCEKIVMVLPQYVHKNIVIRSLKVVYINIPVELLSRSYESK